MIAVVLVVVEGRVLLQSDASYVLFTLLGDLVSYSLLDHCFCKVVLLLVFLECLIISTLLPSSSLVVGRISIALDLV